MLPPLAAFGESIIIARGSLMARHSGWRVVSYSSSFGAANLFMFLIGNMRGGGSVTVERASFVWVVR